MSKTYLKSDHFNGGGSTRHHMRHMPVLRDGKLAGIISIGDVVKHRLDDLESETNVLRDAYMARR